jgi:anti-repressor protein
MNSIQIFNSNEFGEIRTITKDDETYFVGKDVAKALGFTNPRDAIATHVFDEDKGVETIDTLGGKQSMTVINESGVYALVFGSRLESAKRFKHWVTSEVLPSIRKNGGYIAGQETLSDDELMAKALIVANNKIAERDKIIEQKQARIEQMKPKEIFADAVSASHTSILVGDLAKLICQNGYQIGQKRLFDWLRANGYLIKSGGSYNMPKQRYVEQGLFEVKESNLQNPDGSVRITRTTKVTGKGQVYFVNKFLKGGTKVETT